MIATELDENGKIIDMLEERNKSIKKRLASVVKDLKAESESGGKKSKIGYRFIKQLQAELALYGQMDLDASASMNYETLNRYWIKYLELTAYYNRFFEFVDNKQLFIMFCGINDDIYESWEQSTDEKVRSLTKTINSSFLALGWVAGESGGANPSAVKTRLSAKGVGHNVVSASDELVAQAISTRTPHELERELRAILGTKN